MGFIRNLGGPELLIILLIVLVLFGSSRLPDLARSIGASAKELRLGLGGSDSDTEADTGSVDAKELA